MSNTVCKFWRNGNCRFGRDCRFLHEEPSSSNSNNNRYNAFNNNTNTNSNASRFLAPPSNSFNNNHNSNNSNAPRNPFGAPTQNTSNQPPLKGNARYYDDAITPTNLALELRTEKPLWPLSSFAGHSGAPKNLIDVTNEFSPEEARVAYYLARSQGKEQIAQQDEVRLANEASQLFSKILSDPEGARQYVNKGKTEHPNRWDNTDRWDPVKGQGLSKRDLQQQDGNSNTNNSNTPSPFGVQPSNAAFGQPAQPSAFGAKPTNPFGQPTASQGAFGQASALGQKTNPFASAAPAQPAAASQPAFGQSGFGQPAFGQTAAPNQPSAFGQPAQPSAFGQSAQPSAFGKPAFGQGSAFGATAQPPTQTSAFGNAGASPFGQVGGNASNSTSAFGQPAQPSAFGQAAAPTQPSAFGQSSTAAPTQPSAFGAPSSLGAKPNPFAGFQQTQQQPQTQQSPTDTSMGGSTPTPANAFSAFGQQQKLNPFASATSQSAVPSLNLIQPTPPTSISGSQAPSAFSTQSKPLTNGFGAPTQQQPNGFGAATSRPKNYDIRHLLANGQPPAPNPDTEAPREMYGEQMGEYERAYRYVAEKGVFLDDVVPEMPPWVGWVVWG